MANSRKRPHNDDENTINAIVAEIARIMTVGASGNVKFTLYRKEREAFFSRVNLKDDEALINCWKNFRLKCAAKKTIAAEITREVIVTERLFNFSDANLKAFKESGMQVALNSTSTAQITSALRKPSAATKVKSVSFEDENESIIDKSESAPVAIEKPIVKEDVFPPLRLAQIAADQASIITDLNQPEAERATKAMRYTVFFDAKTLSMQHRERALKIQANLLSASIDKMQTMIKHLKSST